MPPQQANVGYPFSSRCGQSQNLQFVSSAISRSRLYFASRSDWRIDPFLNGLLATPLRGQQPNCLPFPRYEHSVRWTNPLSALVCTQQAPP